MSAGPSNGRPVFNYVISKHGHNILLHAGHQYCIQHTNKDFSTTWRCVNSNSKSRCKGSLAVQGAFVVTQTRHSQKCISHSVENEVKSIINASEQQTNKKDNPPNVAKEEETYRRLIIRSAAKLIREKKTPDEIRQVMKDEFGCDWKTLWNLMRNLTIKKLNCLIAADDRLENIPPAARLTNTDWLLFDLALVHENIDVIGQQKTKCTGVEYKPLMDLFSLVQKFEIEDHIVAENYEELPKAWALATHHYNKGGRMCSPMLLQKRWFQLKEVTRAKFYIFWKLYRGNLNNLTTAQFFVPTKLQTAVAKRFQYLVTEDSISWEQAYERKAIVSPEELKLVMENFAGLRNSDDKAPDIVLLEPVIETVALDSDSESESKGKRSSSKDEITAKSETLQINIKKEVTEFRIEETDQENHSSDNEEDRKLNFEKFNMTPQIFDETNISTPQIDNYLEISNTITKERDEILRRYNLVVSTPQILNDVNSGKTSSHENTNKIGSLIIPEKENNDTKIRSVDEEAKDVKMTMSRMLFDDNEKVHNSVELNTEVPANVDFSRDVIGFVNDDIEFVDDGTDESGNEDESGEQKAKDEDIVMQVDPKLLMTVEVCTTKLDDMFMLKGNFFETISDSRIINSVLAQSKPVWMLKENVSSIKTASKVGIDDINENYKVNYYSKLLKKPISLNYNPKQLCKNPDFNTRLKRLTESFFSSMRNRQQYKVCKPVTIDVSKAFESKLVDGTLYLKNSFSPEQPCPKQKKVYNHFSQQVSALPSAKPVRSLIDHTVVSCADADVDKISNYKIDKFSKEELENAYEHYRELLNGQVSPIRLSRPSLLIPDNATVNTTHNIKAPKCYSNSNKKKSKKDLLSAPFSITSNTATIKPTTSEHNNFINDENNQEDEKIAPNFIKTENTLPSETNKNLNNQTNQQITSLTPSSIQTNNIVSSELIFNTLNKDEIKRKPPLIDMPLFKRSTNTIIEESLLTLDTLNNLLSILSSGGPYSIDTNKLRRKSKATTASTSNKTKTMPPKKKPQKRDFNKYCCWIRRKLRNPFLPNRYHSCKANNCNCCCKSCVLSSIVEYDKRNEPDAVMKLIVFFKYFQRKYGGSLEGVVSNTLKSSQDLTVNSPVCKSPVVNVDQDKTHANSIEENSQQMYLINSAGIPPLILIVNPAKSNVSCEVNVPATSGIHEQALATSPVSSSSNSTAIPSNVITTKPVDVAVDNDVSTVLVSSVTSFSSPSSFSKNAISHETIGINDLDVSNVLEVSTVSDSLDVTGDNNDINVPEIFGECHFVNSEPVLVDVPNTIASNIPQPVDESRLNLIKRRHINKKPIKTNMDSTNSPIFLENNQILLTSAKFPNNQNTSQMLMAIVPDDLVPPGIQFVLLPDGRLTYIKDPNVELTDQQAASLPLLVSSIQDQLETALTTAKLEETPKDSNMSNKSNPNETILLIDDTEEIETLNKNVKNPSNISNETNFGNIISLIDEADHINTPNRNPNEGQDQNLSTQPITSQKQANIDLNGTPIENRTTSEIFYTKTSESEVANTTTSVSNNIEWNDPQDDIQTADGNTSAEKNYTDDKDDSSSTISNKISTNNADTVKKSILSPMSGILTEDTKCISPKTSVKVVLDITGVKQNLAHNIQLHSTLSPIDKSNISKEICELYPVNSYEELRYACDVKAHFFKLDIQTGVIAKIKVCISKKKKKSKNNRGRKCHEGIDRTEYRTDAETSNMSAQTEDKICNQVLAKRIILENNFKRRKLTIFGPPKSAVDTHLQDITEDIKPIESFKVSHTKRKRNNNRENTTYDPKKRRKQQSDMVDSDAPMDSSEDDLENYVSESDDEPLSVEARRIHKPVVERFPPNILLKRRYPKK